MHARGKEVSHFLYLHSLIAMASPVPWTPLFVPTYPLCTARWNDVLGSQGSRRAAPLHDGRRSRYATDGEPWRSNTRLRWCGEGSMDARASTVQNIQYVPTSTIMEHPP